MQMVGSLGDALDQIPVFLFPFFGGRTTLIFSNYAGTPVKLLDSECVEV